MSDCKQKRRQKRTNHRSYDGYNNRTQFGERLNKSRQTIWRWERDALLPPPDGHDPYGNPLWLDSTIKHFVASKPTAA